MHEIAASVGPTVIILIGILYGILCNQRGLDKLEARLDHRIDGLDSCISRLENHIDGRLDKIQDDLNTFHRSLGQHDKAIEVLEKRAT